MALEWASSFPILGHRVLLLSDSLVTRHHWGSYQRSLLCPKSYSRLSKIRCAFDSARHSTLPLPRSYPSQPRRRPTKTSAAAKMSPKSRAVDAYLSARRIAKPRIPMPIRTRVQLSSRTRLHTAVSAYLASPSSNLPGEPQIHSHALHHIHSKATHPDDVSHPQHPPPSLPLRPALPFDAIRTTQQIPPTCNRRS